MSLIITVVLSIYIILFLYSGCYHTRNICEKSIIYKNSPSLLNLHVKLASEYKVAKQQKCYGEMGRVSKRIVQIEKELEARFEHTRIDSYAVFSSKHNVA